MLPAVSILMPVRNGARWIAEAVDSVLAQTFRDFELIVIDDGSTDDTAEIVIRRAAEDDRILLLRKPALGLVAALNVGLAAARAPLIARLDADDIAEPMRLAEQAAAMTERPDIVLLGSFAREIDAAGRLKSARKPETSEQSLRAALLRGNPMIHSAVMMRAAAVRDVGGYRAAFMGAEDYDLWLRLREKGAIANLPRELIRYRVHGDSVTACKTLQLMFAARLAQRAAALRAAGGRDNFQYPDGAFDLWAEPPAGYEDDVALYRLLAWAEPSTVPPDQIAPMPDIAVLTRLDLDRRERRVAQRAVARILEQHPRKQNLSVWWRLIALRPLRALPHLVRSMTRRPMAGRG